MNARGIYISLQCLQGHINVFCKGRTCESCPLERNDRWCVKQDVNSAICTMRKNGIDFMMKEGEES